MNRPSIARSVAFLVACAALSAQALRPERQVAGNIVTSAHDPAVRIELPRSVRYAGADRWVLYGMADCELHAFVEAGANRKVRRLYWVQFESYLPTRPELHHTYDSPRHAQVGGRDFYVDTWAESMAAKDEPGSDSEHIKALLRGRGYELPDSMIAVRLVNLPDHARRKELMIIYSEDAAPTGFTAADLRPGGQARERWPAIADGLVERALGAIAIRGGSP